MSFTETFFQKLNKYKKIIQFLNGCVTWTNLC